jgi:hypothetical protein
MQATTVTTERDEAFRAVYNAWVERYPNSKLLTDAQIYALLNDYMNDAEYLIEKIKKMPEKTSDGYEINYKYFSSCCKNNWGGDKKKIRRDQVALVGYEEDSNGNLTAYGQHRKMMDAEWKVPTIEGFDPRNKEHLQIQADYLLRSGQIGEPQYELMMKGIPIVTGEIDLNDKLHLVLDVADSDDNVPF